MKLSATMTLILMSSAALYIPTSEISQSTGSELLYVVRKRFWRFITWFNCIGFLKIGDAYSKSNVYIPLKQDFTNNLTTLHTFVYFFQCLFMITWGLCQISSSLVKLGAYLQNTGLVHLDAYDFEKKSADSSSETVKRI